MCYSLLLLQVGGKLSSPAILTALTKAVKKDDSLLSLGLAFHTASLCDGDLAKMFDRIEDAVVQADEVSVLHLHWRQGVLFINFESFIAT